MNAQISASFGGLVSQLVALNNAMTSIETYESNQRTFNQIVLSNWQGSDRGSFTIHLSGLLFTTAYVEVLDAMECSLRLQTIFGDQATSNVEGLKKGLYYACVTVQSGRMMKAQKVVVQNQ